MLPLVAALIKAGLPVLGSVLAEKGKSWVEEKTGIKLPDTTTQVLTPDQIVQLKTAEMQHEEVLLEHALKISQQKLDEKKVEIADTADARKMQTTALQSTDDFSRRFIYWLAGLAITATAVYIGAITFGTIPKENIRFADTTLGFLLGTVISTIINFFFGTSRSSEKNGDTVRQVVNKVLDQGEQK